LAESHFERARYHGALQIWVDLMLNKPAELPVGGILYRESVSFPNTPDCLNVGPDLQGQGNANAPIALPLSADRIIALCREILNPVARGFRGVLRYDLEFLRPAIEQALSAPRDKSRP
jgi:hypothetical protein